MPTTVLEPGHTVLAKYMQFLLSEAYSIVGECDRAYMITEMHGYFQAMSKTEKEAYKCVSSYRREA